MSLKGGVAIDRFEEGQPATRGLGTILVPHDAERRTLPLARVSIAARVVDRVAEVIVTQVFRNTFTSPIEAVYMFPLDGGCAVSAFEMQIGERTLRGCVKARADARAQYQKALDQGRRAALLEQDRDDVFTVQLGNLPPREDATVRLTYSEELTYFEDGATELRLPLVLGMRYIPGEPIGGDSAGRGTELDTDVVQDASRITPPRLADGFDPQVDLSIHVEIVGPAPAGLTCSQHATRTDGNAARTSVALARTDERLDRDFVLRWRVAGASGITPRLFFHRDRSGERHGILSVGAGAGPVAARPRDVVFVLDRSGSMQGAKIASAARACGVLLNTLGPADRFGLLAFSDRPEWLTGSGGTDSLLQADRSGITRGEHLLHEVRANGGTELYTALERALAVARMDGDKSRGIPVIVLITDGEVGDESRVVGLVQRAGVRVFTVGVDTSVNTGLLKRVAQVTRGTFVLTEPGAALDDALGRIAREIGAPLVEDLAVALEDGTITGPAPERLPDLFAGRAATIAFRADSGHTLRITGRSADGGTFSAAVTGTEVDLPAIPHLWARRRISDLEDRYRLAPAGQKGALEQEIVTVSTAHSVLCRFTAFVVVDDAQAIVSTADRRTIVQPVELPHLWASASVHSSPEAAPLRMESRVSFADLAPLDELLDLGSLGLSRSRPVAARSGRTVRASTTPNAGDLVALDVQSHMEELLDLLRETHHNRTTRDYHEMLDHLERVMAAMPAAPDHHGLTELRSLLERLRDCLRATVAATAELAGLATDLARIWAEVSKNRRRFRPFWEHV